MLPRRRPGRDVQAAEATRSTISPGARAAQQIPLHRADRDARRAGEVAAIAAHPRVESLSFGLMDFVKGAPRRHPAVGDDLHRPVRSIR